VDIVKVTLLRSLIDNVLVSASEGEANLEIEDFVKKDDLENAIKKAGYTPTKVEITEK